MANNHLRGPAARSKPKPSFSILAMLGDEGEDRLSKLPDDVLISIVERLDIADAARTSILSRRWRQIPAMLSKVVIAVGSFKCRHRRSKLHRHDVGWPNSNLVEATRSILGSRTTNLYTIDLLRLQFYLGDDSILIGKAVSNTMATQKVCLAEFTIITKKDRTRCTHEEKIAYGRQLRSFIYACPNAFSGLTRLKLENLTLSETDFPKIFSTCTRLEFLRLHDCDMGMFSLLEVEHPLLNELEIADCSFEEVYLKWLPKITLLTFSGWISQHDPVTFGYVPLLQSMSINSTGLCDHKMLKLSELLGNTTISDLHLNFQSEKIWIEPEGPKELYQVFHKLRIVDLVNISEDCELNWTMFILQGAPSLEELCIRVRDHLCDMVQDEAERQMYGFSEEKKDKGLEWNASASDFKHQKLAVLRIFGFQTEDKFVSHIRRVMEAAVNLENIYLYNKTLCKKCQHWVEKPSRYPYTLKQKTSLLNKVNHGIASSVKFHFPNLTTC